MRHRAGLIVQCGVLVAGLGIVAMEVVVHSGPSLKNPAGAQVVPAPMLPTSSPPILPSTCQPQPAVADSVDEGAPSAAAAANKTGQPLKDLAIQPADLSSAQWTSLLDIAGSAGIGVISSVVNWAAYEPTGPSTPDWTALEAFVQAVTGRGMEMRLILSGFPDWARDPGDPPVKSVPTLAPAHPDELARWATFVSNVVSQFNSQVSFYEIWNEEDIDLFWGGRADPAQYAGLLACSYQAAKAVDPGAVIVSGGLATNDVGYTEELYAELNRLPNAASDRHFFDVLGVHPYGDSVPPTSSSPDEIFNGPFGVIDHNFSGFIQLHTVMNLNGDGAKKLYLGEFGWPLIGASYLQDNGFTPISENTRASWLPLAYRVAGKTGLVVALSWYTFYPTPYDPPSWALVHNPDGTEGPSTTWVETPSFHALAEVP